MALMEVYSCRDSKVEAFLPPFYARRRGEALRAFKSAVGSEGHDFSKYKEDYALYFLGTFNDESGVFESMVPVLVMTALEATVVE